jgi:hypothetical protein
VDAVFILIIWSVALRQLPLIDLIVSQNELIKFILFVTVYQFGYFPMSRTFTDVLK